MGFNTVRISKVMGHADEAMVRAGAVRDLDRLGANGADEAADFGRRRVPWLIIDARRIFSGVCSWWRPIVLSCGVSNVELLILYELWAGERLQLEKAVPRYRRPGRSISVSAVPFGPGTDIWRSCRFVGALFRGLRDLPFGLRRFVPCDIGANHCRLRHIGWEKCGHGITPRP